MLKKTGVACAFLVIVICFLIYGYFNFATNNSVLKRLNQLPQNMLTYIDQETNFGISPTQQKILADSFIKYYFHPWQQPVSSGITELKNSLVSTLSEFQKDPGLGATTLRHLPKWIHNLTEMWISHPFP